MQLSVIVIAYAMQREIPRTLQALARSYQTIGADLDYEVILVDNGSPEPLRTDALSDAVPVQLLRIEGAAASPAQALNRAAELAQGEVLCLMIDGAHLLTPGVFEWALRAFAAFTCPVVAARYFYMGPGEQPETVLQGYNQAAEDALLQQIDWPRDGYRLFEVGTPLSGGAANITWFNRMFESNCLFMTREHYFAVGGSDERFDLPGGGFLNLDLYKRALDAAGAVSVQLVGEGSFHQVHGGTTTNSERLAREARLADYRRQYETLRGHSQLLSDKPLQFLGHLPTQASKIHLRKRRG
ncbi:glycosyltransferase family A protein [Haliea salexigens]|jgi:glycosyltransferase involved in cell wall biosynthesis|uniref:glycosyltransferase family A protein n=1 Tax=Haliea salexigens TaxID=287487 RepID=UPI0003FB0476|nr:glycosyltransferase family A protein [Haliea salexigens]|tara:strand:+ start:18770 stop:19663 length:894 start_codon:yes stop_codon:yes gene_type:complete